MPDEKKVEEPTLAEQLITARREVERTVREMQLLKYKQSGTVEMLRRDFDNLTVQQQGLLAPSIVAGQTIIVDQIMEEISQ